MTGDVESSHKLLSLVLNPPAPEAESKVSVELTSCGVFEDSPLMKNFKYGEPLSLFAHGQAGDGSLAEAEEFGLPRRVISLKTDSKRATALGWLTGLTRRRIKADSLREDLPEFAYKSEAGAAAKFGQTALPMELQYEAFESTYSRVWTKIFLIVPKSFNILFNQYKLDKVCQFIT